LAFASVTGWNFYVVLWGGVALVAVYTIKGGLASVMWTDAVQCLFLMGGGVLLFWVALGHVPGGWAAMAAAQPERFHLYHPANDPLAPFAGIIAGVFSVFTFYQAGNQVMIQRVLGARSIWDGLVGIVWSGFINLFRPLVTCLLGLIVFHWVSVLHAAPPLANPDQAFPFALKVFAPDWGLRGIVLAGFLAAVMSTVSALANSTATLFSLDVYHKLIRPRATDRELVFAGKAAAFAALVVAALLAPAVEHFGGIFRYFQTGVTLLATPFITVIWLGVFWPRANYASALFGLVGGLLITVTTALGVPAFLNTFAFAELPGWLRAVTSTTVDATGHTQIGVHWLYLALLAQVQIIIGMVVVALVTRRPDSELIRPLLWRPALLKQFARDRPRPWYQNVWLYFALYAVLWFAVYWRFW
jgi:SSS family solute:Na+ symporter